MIRFYNTVTPSPEQWKMIIMGTRNPMNSWDRYDSYEDWSEHKEGFKLGPNDYKLLSSLAKAGPDHRKFMRMITVYVDIDAPLYWWKEFDTYKVGTVANSCSTMHKIHAKEFSIVDFSCEHLLSFGVDARENIPLIDVNPFTSDSKGYPYCLEEEAMFVSPGYLMTHIVNMLNMCREKYLETKDKKYWWQMIQLLPSSYDQTRTVMLNYEVLRNMYHARKAHKLDEWRDFCEWIKELPYSEFITGEAEK